MMRVLSDGCEFSIVKNGAWLDKDREYVKKIKETLTNASKKFKQAYPHMIRGYEIFIFTIKKSRHKSNSRILPVKISHYIQLGFSNSI
jgi:hypothetical protein